MKKIILFLGILISYVNSIMADSKYITLMKEQESRLFLAAKNRKWHEVIELADSFLVDMPNHPEVIFLKAEALSYFGKDEEALKNYELAMKMNSCVWLSEVCERTFNNAMAECLFKLKKYERALLYYNSLFIGKDTILNDYVEEDMNKVRAEFKKSDRYTKIKQLEKDLDNAESLGKFDEVITIADALIELTYKTGQIRCRKAKALALRGKHREAIELYEEALKYMEYVEMVTDKEYHWNKESINEDDIHQLIVDSFIALEDFEGALRYYNSLTPFYRGNDSLKETIELVKAERKEIQTQVE